MKRESGSCDDFFIFSILQSEAKPLEDMARKKKEEKSPEILQLEARIRELEL